MYGSPALQPTPETPEGPATINGAQRWGEVKSRRHEVGGLAHPAEPSRREEEGAIQEAV